VTDGLLALFTLEIDYDECYLNWSTRVLDTFRKHPENSICLSSIRGVVTGGCIARVPANHDPSPVVGGMTV